MIYTNSPHYNLNQNLNENYQSFGLGIKKNHRTNTAFALASLSLLVTTIVLATFSLLPYLAILATISATYPATINFYTSYQFCNMLNAFEAKDWDSALKAYNSLYDRNHALPFINQNYYAQTNAPHSEIPTQLKQIISMNLAVKVIYTADPDLERAGLLLSGISQVSQGFHPSLEELQANQTYYTEFLKAEEGAEGNLRIFRFTRPELPRDNPCMTLVIPEQAQANNAAAG